MVDHLKDGVLSPYFKYPLIISVKQANIKMECGSIHIDGLL